jgi:hypothetical protein
MQTVTKGSTCITNHKWTLETEVREQVLTLSPWNLANNNKKESYASSVLVVLCPHRIAILKLSHMCAAMGQLGQEMKMGEPGISAEDRYSMGLYFSLHGHRWLHVEIAIETHTHTGVLHRWQTPAAIPPQEHWAHSTQGLGSKGLRPIESLWGSSCRFLEWLWSIFCDWVLQTAAAAQSPYIQQNISQGGGSHLRRLPMEKADWIKTNEAISYNPVSKYIAYNLYGLKYSPGHQKDTHTGLNINREQRNLPCRSPDNLYRRFTLEGII